MATYHGNPNASVGGEEKGSSEPRFKSSTQAVGSEWGLLRLFPERELSLRSFNRNLFFELSLSLVRAQSGKERVENKRRKQKTTFQKK